MSFHQDLALSISNKACKGASAMICRAVDAVPVARLQRAAAAEY